jgi:hypothetical protein
MTVNHSGCSSGQRRHRSERKHGSTTWHCPAPTRRVSGKSDRVTGVANPACTLGWWRVEKFLSSAIMPRSQLQHPRDNRGASATMANGSVRPAGRRVLGPAGGRSTAEAAARHAKPERTQEPQKCWRIRRYGEGRESRSEQSDTIGVTGPDLRHCERHSNPRSAGILAMSGSRPCWCGGNAIREGSGRRYQLHAEAVQHRGRATAPRHAAVQLSAAMILPTRSMLPSASRCSRPGHCMRNRT